MQIVLEPIIDDACIISKSFSQDAFYKYNTVYKFFLCIFATSASFYLIVTKGTRWVLNLNARLIYGCHLAFSIFLPISLIYGYAYDLYRFFFLKSEDYCDYAITSGFSMQVRLPAILAMSGESLTLFFLSLERLISTLYPSKYERFNRNSIGLLFSFFSIIFSVGSSYGLMLPGVDADKLVSSFTIRRDENFFRFQLYTVFQIIIQVSSISIFFWSFCRNNKQHKIFTITRKAQFGARYQVTENRKVVSLLLPTSIANTCVLSFTVVTTTAFNFLYRNDDHVGYTVFGEVVFQAPLYSLILPFIITYQLKQRSSVVLNTTVQQEEYFKTLQSYFDSNIVERARMPKELS